MKKTIAAEVVGVALFVAVFVVLAVTAGPKIYWHFTFEAFLDPHDTSAREWAWVSMVEYDKAKAYSSEAATARQYGGTIQGTVLAFIRGTAWRSSHRYTVDMRCNDRPAKMEISWSESESESVYCTGQMYASRLARDPRTGRQEYTPGEFSFGFTSRRVLHEDGRWEDLAAQSHVFVGAINIGGQPQETTRGNFVFRCVNYRDPLKHYRHCGKAWAEQYITAFRHFEVQSLRVETPALESFYFMQEPFGPRDAKNIVWEVHRTTNREHPHWKQKTM